jgi:CRP-like cAMP-binding protein
MEDVTLAFVGPGQPDLVRLDPDRHYALEAIVNSECELNYEVQAECEQELIASWLLSFHLIRHSLGSDQRLNRLLFFLAEQFGIASPVGFRIPFTLPHTRFAELIGSTRSTVTRQLVALRDQGRLTLSDSGPSMVLHNNPEEPHFWC